jgi:hypothetical protein
MTAADRATQQVLFPAFGGLNLQQPAITVYRPKWEAGEA